MSKQRDKDFGKPAPALVKRINAAIGRWEVGERDFYQQMTEAYPFEKPSEKELTEEVLAELDDMEGYFTDQLEHHLKPGNFTAALAFLQRAEPDSPTDEIFLPMLGLISTASCRREIRAGRAAAAASEMCTAEELYWMIAKIKEEWMDDMLRSPGPDSHLTRYLTEFWVIRHCRKPSFNCLSPCVHESQVVHCGTGPVLPTQLLRSERSLGRGLRGPIEAPRKDRRAFS